MFSRILWGLAACWVFSACYLIFLEFPKAFRIRIQQAIRHPFHSVRKAAVRFWHWSAKWDWFAVLFLGALALIAIGEFGFGIFVLVLSAVSLFSRLIHWGGFADHRVLTGSTKALGGLGVIVLLATFLIITIEFKGDTPWSHLPNGIIRIADAWHPTATLPPVIFLLPKVPTDALRRTPVWVMQQAKHDLQEFLHPPIVKPTPQPITPERKASLVFTFQKVAEDAVFPIVKTEASLVDAAVAVEVTFQAIGDVSAKDGSVWIRICTGCIYAQEAEEFHTVGADHPWDREKHFALILGLFRHFSGLRSQG